MIKKKLIFGMLFVLLLGLFTFSGFGEVYGDFLCVDNVCSCNKEQCCYEEELMTACYNKNEEIPNVCIKGGREAGVLWCQMSGIVPGETRAEVPAAPPRERYYVSERGKQIDEVWGVIRYKLGLTGDPAEKIWDPNSKGWFVFDKVYLPATSAAAGTAATGYDLAGYDRLFKIYGSKHGVDPALLKAIAKYESGLNPLTIGPAGEIGLFQFLAATARSMGFGKVTNCCTKTSLEKYSCDDERKTTGGIWKPNVFLCNPDNDDRFNLELSVDKGGKFVKSNYDYFGKYSVAAGTDRIKLAIAAHHLGAGGVERCIKGGLINKIWPNSNCKADLSRGEISWEAVLNNMPDTLYKGEKTYRQVMDNYVNGIYNKYQQYKAEMAAR